MLFLILYNGPLIVLAAFWLYFRTQGNANFHVLRLMLDIAIVAVAIARLFGSSIPPSGHAALLTHTLISVSNRYYRIAALLMLIATIALKISWGDYESWSYGLVVGVITGTAWVLVGRGSGGEIQTSEV